MTKNILLLAHLDESGNDLPKAASEALGAAVELSKQLNAALSIGLIGGDVQAAADSVANCGAKRLLAITGPEFAQPRFASDLLAADALCRAAAADLILAPATSRFLRALPGLAHRLNGRVDTHITSVQVVDGAVCATRWFYRQRIEGVFQRDVRPWIMLLDSGCHEAYSGASGKATIEKTAVTLPAEARRTTIAGIRAPKSDSQTIRPDAALLFVAGAGWTKKQPDGKSHPEQAEMLILGFLRASGASLGGSKSLVDQSGENQTVLGFMTHLNQVGQTGATPRHPKGLSTCCHGEEPHVVGWRFINERRAINLDPNCGWARGKADVLYVADAFEVMAKVNELLKKPQA
ncbi:MAG: electron transfer flavoprotein subunit alpha/FixB family protein [Candidatus Acidiferrales bacterium]